MTTTKAVLSRDEFHRAIEELADVSVRINEVNAWIVHVENGVKFLVKRNDIKELRGCDGGSASLVAVTDDGGGDDAACDDVLEALQDDADAAAVQTTAPQRRDVLVYEWHVCYSVSYQAPAIYFRACQLGKATRSRRRRHSERGQTARQ
jgi:hypothetical protein